MKITLLHKLLMAGCFLITLSAQGQPDHLAYAITDSVHDGIRWNYLRTLDLRTGAYSNVLLHLLSNTELKPPPGVSNFIPSNGVAAIAYDKRNKRLYYVPMLTDKLAYIDIKTMKNHVVTNNFTGLMPKESDQSNIVTRMVIGDDDKGYALTNDGRHLIRFRTDSNPNITDLGPLVDAPGNNETSVHNACSSFGGDIIADDDDKLYLITFGRNIFKINLDTRVAKFMSGITGLPPTFNISGAVADKSGEKAVIVSNTDASDVYNLNIKNGVASRMHANNPWLTSDLANASVLKTKDHGNHHDDRIIAGDFEENENIQLYPNPVTAKAFKIHFTDVEAGTYTIEVVDVGGKLILTKQVTIGGKTNTVSVDLPGVIGSGIYFVRINGNSKAIFNGKIFVQ